MKLTSPAFAENDKIPSQYTCDGDNANPALQVEDVPTEAKSLVLIMDDPDIPDEVKQSRGIQVFDHWLMFNIPPGTKEITPAAGTAGKNSAGNSAYTGPCPPTQYEPKEHRYFFKLYALDAELSLDEGATKAEVEKAMEGHIIAQAQLVGRYQRKEVTQ
ncbi:YbhB/YbcL family Raf kinase inhibitor-like protein [Candidatus Woesearchaeota archaeon CG10_big_fil_rev_8_21_14_0_10_45_16]|nr:MAG: YbhB/YbcL family Raf kinase inhibitor-like protein [Candidatus Woesearchaeota archaeon CG10_big_fil_rev_8_21_14_0_10_45_16]